MLENSTLNIVICDIDRIWVAQKYPWKMLFHMEDSYLKGATDL